MTLDLRSLVGRLTDTSRRGLEGAAGLCLSRTHYDVQIEHWLMKLVDSADAEIHRILRQSEIAPDAFARDLERALGRLQTGNGARPHLSPGVRDLASRGWLLASVNYGASRVRSGVLLLAGLQDDDLRYRLLEISPGLERINVETLARDLPRLLAGSPEEREATAGGEGTRRSIEAGPPGAAAGALDRYTIDLTAAAAEGRIDPVLGRDREIRHLVDILMRRRQNNPILTGEAGVGKTAVVEGLANRIASGDVPESLRGVALRTLDLGLLQAGAGVKGEFENRLKQVIEEVRSSARPVILFIDEAHTMIGAGGAEGQGDAANLLKPALARGELRTIAATTWAEYKKYFEKDAALSRRFQVVKVDEPGEAEAIVMMRGITAKLEQHHGVRILDEAVVEAVRLSSRYIPARQLPDKSVSVLDTACASVALGRQTTAAPIEDLRRRIDALSAEIARLEQETELGADHEERLVPARAQRTQAEEALHGLEERFERERGAVTAIVELRDRIVRGRDGGSVTATDGDAAALRGELARLQKELRDLQGEQALLHPDVDAQAIAEIVASWTGIPVGRMVADEIQTILDLPSRLSERVIGQDHALEAIAQRVRTSRASVENPSRPIGVFLLVGPSGVGKTETALALAEALYGGEHNMVTINMSEYQESHTVSKLKGSPPGYVGFGEGGVLTEAVRRRPYSVVLLDEVEKAHPDVRELFFQVFDRGSLEDGEGREIDFRNTVILLTSNVGTDTIVSLCVDPETRPDPEPLRNALRPALQKEFPAAFLGRLSVVPYYPILPDILERIIRLQLARVAERIQRHHRATLSYGEDLVRHISTQCTEPESGARNVDRVLTRNLLPMVSSEILARMARRESFSRIDIAVDESGALTCQVN